MTNANEPAYPRQDERCPTTGHGIREGSPGLTKRELAAFMAMQGIFASGPSASSEADVPQLLANIATFSVQAADALLSELERT
jgi:hypothetical protein